MSEQAVTPIDLEALERWLAENELDGELDEEEIREKLSGKSP